MTIFQTIPIGGANVLSRWAPTLCVLGVLGLAPSAIAGGKPTGIDANSLPTEIHAQYRLRYNGLNVGRLEMTSTRAGHTYKLAGSGSVSLFMGAIR